MNDFARPLDGMRTLVIGGGGDGIGRGISRAFAAQKSRESNLTQALRQWKHAAHHEDWISTQRHSERQVLILFRRGSDPGGTTLPFGFIPAHGSSGESHIGFSVPAESLPAWRARLAERGIPEESSFTWPTGGTSVYFRDPDGHLLELLTPGVWPIY